MKESVTYQSILSEGEAKGELQGVRNTIVQLGTRRFGAPSNSVIEALNNIASVPALQALVDRLLEVESWAELLEV